MAMKPNACARAIRHAALAGLFLLSAGGAAAAVTVSYIEPERFGEVPFATWEREEVLNELTAHFDRLGQDLPAGQDLKVEVLDLRLAGSLRRGNAREIRVLTGGADWPRMHLRYAIESGGKVISSGESKLSDMTYMDRINRYADGDRLRYEKHMIDEWFKKTIGARPPG
jgi:hypothetical protein